jgi:NAD(P)H dehydrogenase (quinone)
MIYAVTGSTGAFGTLAVQSFLEQGVSPSSIVAIARDEAKAKSLKAKGVTVRIADYNDKTSLEAALKGVDRLLLVSGSEVGERAVQHHNIIDAANNAGVKRIAYTSITQAATSKNPLAPEHKATEEELKASGIEYTILRNNWYIENFAGDIAGAKQSGVIAAAVKTGKVGSALRSEYAEAAVRVLIGEGHVGKIYELSGLPWSYQEFAEAVSKVVNRPVQFKTVTESEKKATLIGLGLPEGMAGFYALLDTSIEDGTLAYQSDDIAQILGRAPTGLVESIRKIYN